MALLGAYRAEAQTTPGGVPAQPAFDAHGFHLAPHDGDLRDPLTVQRPGAFDQGDWFGSVMAEYAKAPLVRQLGSELGTETTTEPVVDNLVALNVSAGVALHERIRVDVLAPVFLVSTGAFGEQQQAARGPAMGDVRARAMIVAVRPEPVFDGGGVGFGIIGNLDLPSGTPSRSLGAGGIAGGGELALSYEWAPVTLSGSAGVQFNPEAELGAGGTTDTLLAGLALGIRASDTIGVTLEGNSAPPLPVTGSASTRLPPIEALLSMRYVSASGAFWTLGAAGGMTDGPGVASFRLLLGGGYARRDLGGNDIDTLGVLRASDLCPLEAETFNGWKDDDGCPDRLGTLGVDVKFRGESRAADAEIIGPDGPQNLRIGPQGLTLDAVPGSTWTVKAKDGCLIGEGTATAAEVGSKLVVDMNPAYDAKIRIDVTGPTDAAVSGALVAWRSDKPECVPIGTAMTDGSGSITQDVSSGMHRLVVTASGHSVVEQAINIVPGANPPVKIKLAASKIVLDARQIRILEKVQFEFGKAVIRGASFGLLDEVASVILNAPNIGRVEVGGHTDNKGSDDFNLKLSRDRAYAVREYLIGKGVPADQLVAVGYGETRPIDTNKTEQGREVNRRVEFNLLDHQDR